MSAHTTPTLPLDAPPGPEGDPSVEDSWGIGDLSLELGLTPRTIRYYEDEGLLMPRREGTVRVYSRADRARLTLICRGKRLGFSIAEIKEFLDLYDTDDQQTGQMRYALERARDRITSLEQQLADVHQTLTELRKIEAAIVDHLDQAATLAGQCGMARAPEPDEAAPSEPR